MLGQSTGLFFSEHPSRNRRRCVPGERRECVPSLGYRSRPSMTCLLIDTNGRLGNPHNSFTTQDKARGAEPPSPANGVSVLLDVPLFPLFLVSFSSSKVEA